MRSLIYRALVGGAPSGDRGGLAGRTPPPVPGTDCCCCATADFFTTGCRVEVARLLTESRCLTCSDCFCCCS